MKVMKRIIISISALLVSAAAMVGQNLDPTVEVSRVYEGKLIEVHKPALEMAVPDTMYKFDLGFDYWVFDNPYKGSYEFKPYVMDMRPSALERTRNTFFLQAGAGYTLHPTLDLLWSPVKKGAFSMDVFADHKSYIGEYRAIGENSAWDGYDLLSKAGVDFSYDWRKANFDFGASYYGVADNDFRRKRAYNGVDAYASLRSKSVWPKNFLYDVDMAYRFAEDSAADKMYEHNFSFDASFGPEFKSSKVLFDLGVELDVYTGALAATASRFYIVPHYVYNEGILSLNLGVRLSAVAASGEAFSNKNQVVYPDLRMDLALIKDAMKMYAKIGGGERIQTYSSLLDGNHHIDLSYGMNGAASLLNITVERLSAILGFEGRVSSVFSYNLRGGYVNYKTSPLDAVKSVGGQYVPMLGYSPYQKAFAALDWKMIFEWFRFDGAVEYNHSWGIKDVDMLAPASLEASAAALYNWNNRIHVGIDCNFASGRASSAGFKTPWYADLGVYGEYALNRKLSFWLRGGNLLNMEIQRNPLFAEKGINFTAGICLNL